MDRRRFLLTSLAGALAATPPTTSAQHSLKRVCYAVTTLPQSEVAAFHNTRELVRALNARGWIEGQNFVLELRSAEGRPERYANMMRELVDRRCDVIITTGQSMTQEALRATTTIPVVFVAVDPIAAKFVTGLARPDRNITGVMGPGPEFEGKRLEMVTRALPRARRIAVLHAAWDGVYGEALRNAAARLGLTLLHAPSRPNDYAEAAALISRERPHAIYIGSGAYFAANRRRIIEIAMDNRLPLIGDGPLFVEVGALMSYSGDRTEFWDRTGNYVDRLLKGARPSDLPIEVMTKYELIFNMKTAKALGITIPPAVLLQADRKFE